MTTTSITRTLGQFESGECRWVGREDVHVYCRNPHPRTDDSARYRVFCPDAGLEDGTDWIAACEAAAVVKEIVR